MTTTNLFLIIYIFIFIIGLCIGSFLNVVVLRAFSNESIVFPGSKCPLCQTPLRWYHNIPILSYVFLRGKCRFCKEHISIQYPLVELVTGLSFVAVFLKFESAVNIIFMLVFVSLFIVIAATDIREKVVFDIHTYIIVFLGLAYNFFNIGHFYAGDKLFALGKISFSISNSFIAAVLGILLGIIIMEIFARFGYLVAGTRAFGEGDTYIAAGLGAILGWKYLLTALFYAFVIQIILTIPVFIKKLYKKKDFKTLVLLLVFFYLISYMKWIEYLNISFDFAVFGVLVMLLCVVGFYLCKRILYGLKDPSGMTYLPFGPAMVLGGLIMVFIL